MDDLRTRTRVLILELNQFRKMDPEALMARTTSGGWSVAQILEHLNSYGKYYLPLIETKLRVNKTFSHDYFTSGFFGNYFTNSMLPKNGVVTNKMKTPGGHNASNDPDSYDMIEEFLTQEYLLLQFLDQAESVDLNAIRIPISLTKLIRLKLGDVFGFLVAHHERHFLQIRNTLHEVSRRRQAA